MNILIVAADEAIRRSLSFVLEMHGCAVLEASSGKRAQDTCLKYAPSLDLIIINDDIPDAFVRKFLKTVRTQRFAGKFIILSSYLTPQKKRQYRRQGVAGALSKPFDLSDLRQWLASLPKYFSGNGDSGHFAVECKFGDTVECWGPEVEPETR